MTLASTFTLLSGGDVLTGIQSVEIESRLFPPRERLTVVKSATQRDRSLFQRGASIGVVVSDVSFGRYAVDNSAIIGDDFDTISLTCSRIRDLEAISRSIYYKFVDEDEGTETVTGLANTQLSGLVSASGSAPSLASATDTAGGLSAMRGHLYAALDDADGKFVDIVDALRSFRIGLVFDIFSGRERATLIPLDRLSGSPHIVEEWHEGTLGLTVPDYDNALNGFRTRQIACRYSDPTDMAPNATTRLDVGTTGVPVVLPRVMPDETGARVLIELRRARLRRTGIRGALTVDGDPKFSIGDQFQVSGGIFLTERVVHSLTDPAGAEADYVTILEGSSTFPTGIGSEWPS